MRSSTKNKPFIPKLSDVWFKIVVNKKGESIKRHYYQSPNAGILQISKKALEDAGIDLNKIKEKTEDKTTSRNKSKSRSGTRSVVRSKVRSRVRSKSSSNSSPITRIRRSQTTSRKSPSKVLKIRVKRLESKTPLKIGSRYKDTEQKRLTRAGGISKNSTESKNKKIILTLKEKDKIAEEIKEGIEVAKEGVNEMIQKAQMRSKSPKITRVTSKDKAKIIKAISESNNPEKQIDNIAKNISKGLNPVSRRETSKESESESESKTISKNKSFKLKDQKVKGSIKVRRSKIKSKSSNMVHTTNKRSSAPKPRNFRSTSRIERLIRETKRSKK